MSNFDQTNNINFTVDQENLYREEVITDIKVASIRRLVPVKSDGTEDTSRPVMFIGHSQLMSPEGPVPIQSKLEAENLEEAIKEFPTAMKAALNEILEQIVKMRQQQQQQQDQHESRIIVPRR